MKNLILHTSMKLLAGIILTSMLIFLPAGSIHFWQGWVLMPTLFIPVHINGILMLILNPQLLRKRLNDKEKEKEQKLIIRVSSILFGSMFIVSGLNYRYGWTHMPETISWCAVGTYLIGYCLYAEVLRENPYLSRTIETSADQKLISTGLYSLVRHPMYTSTIIMFLSIPLILGSFPSLLIMLLYIPVINYRIKHEETFLEKNLQGYSAYKQKVRYRIIPFIA